MPPLVSVCIITYNHAPYIRQAVDSVLAQKTDFDFEIIIGEDDSSDDTRSIVKEYKERHPDKIRLFLNDRKNVIYIDGRPTGRWNFVNCLKHATGKYVALLEGDDYWTNPAKLQEQVDYLESHPECVLCFHSVQAVFEDSRREPEIRTPQLKKEIYTLEDIIKGNFIQTCSVVFRNGLFSDFPKWFYRTPMADWPLHVLNAQHGNIGYLEEVMGAYRFHEGGLWSGRSKANRIKNTIQLYKIFDHHLHGEYRKILKTKIHQAYFEIATSLIPLKFEKKIGHLLQKNGLKGIVRFYKKIFHPIGSRH
jgi:glycosyltransferase involved in cell wall biosynthesis